MANHVDLLPGLPDDVASLCLARLPFFSHLPAAAVCRSWRAFFSSSLPWTLRAAHAMRQGDLLLLCTGLWTSSAGEPALVFHVWDPQLDAWMRLPPLFAGRAFAPHAFEGFCCTAVGAPAAPIAAETVESRLSGVPPAVGATQKNALRASARGVAAGAQAAQPARPALFVLGGEYRFSPRLGGSSSLAERMPHAWCLDLGSGRWQQLADMSRCRVNLHAAVVLPARSAPFPHGSGRDSCGAAACAGADAGGGGGGCRLLALGGSSDPVGSYSATARGDGRGEGLGGVGSEERWAASGDAELDDEGRMWVGEALDLDRLLSCDGESARDSRDEGSAWEERTGGSADADAVPCDRASGGFSISRDNNDGGAVWRRDACGSMVPCSSSSSSRDGNSGAGSSSSRAFNLSPPPPHDTWRRFARMPPSVDPSARVRATAVLTHRLFVFSSHASPHDAAPSGSERLDFFVLSSEQWHSVGLIRGASEGWTRGPVAAVEGVGLLCVGGVKARVGIGQVDIAWLDVEAREWVVVAQVPVGRELGWASSVTGLHVAAAGRRLFVLTEGALVQRVGFCMKKVKPVNGMHVLTITPAGDYNEDSGSRHAAGRDAARRSEEERDGTGGTGGTGGSAGGDWSGGSLGNGAGGREKGWEFTWEVGNMELASAVVGCAALHI